MSGEQPTKTKLVDDQVTRTGNHDRRPRTLLPIGSSQPNWDTSQPITCLIRAPAPPSGSCTPLTGSQQQQQHQQQGRTSDAEPPSDQTLNPTVFYTTSVQYANVTPNRACSLLVEWEKPDEAKRDDRQPSAESSSKLQTSNSQMLNVRNPPPELSVSPADTLSKPSSSDNLSAFSPIASLNNEPLNDSFTRFHSLQHRSRKHRKFKQISPLNSPIWPSSQFDTYNRPSSQPHSPSSLSVNYLPSPARDRSYSAGCTSSNFVFPANSSNAAAANVPNAANPTYASNHSLAEKQNSVGTLSPASSINDFTIEIEALEKAVRSNDWKLVKKLLNAHCSNLNRVYSSSSMNLNLATKQSVAAVGPANKPSRASLFEKLSGTEQAQSTTKQPANQSFTQYRAYSAFDASVGAAEKGIRKESGDSQLSANFASRHGRIESPLFNNVLHLAIEYSSIDVVCLLLQSGFSANTNNQTPLKSLDVWRRRSDSSYDSNHMAASQSNEMLDANGPLLFNQMGSRMLYSSREQLVPLLSSSPHLLSPSAVPSNGSNSNLYALCNNKMRFSLTSEQSSDQNSELSSIGRYSGPTKLIKMNPSLPYFLKIVRIGSQEQVKSPNEINLRRLLQESKLHFKEFNCCKCCSCQTENLTLSQPKQASSKSNRKISVDTTHSAAANRRKSSATVSLANMSGIIQHAVQKNVNTLEKTLHYHHPSQPHSNATATSSLNTIGGNAPGGSGSGNGTIKGQSNEQLSSRSHTKSELNKDLNKLSVCCVSNAFNKRNCCGTRYAANRYHCHCPLKEILIKRNLIRKLAKRLTNEKFKFSDDLDLSKLEELLKTGQADQERSERIDDLDSVRDYLRSHFREHRHIVNPFEDSNDSTEPEEERIAFNKNSSLNRLLDSNDESDEKEDDSTSSSEDEQRILSRDYTKINSDKSTNGSDDEKEKGDDDGKDSSSVEKSSKKEDERTPSLKRKRKRRKEPKLRDQAPLLIIDEQRKRARRRRKQKKMFKNSEEAKRCSSVSGGQDSDEQQKLIDYENNFRICSSYSRMNLEASEDTELSDSSITFDSEQEMHLSKERETTSKDELSDESTCSQKLEGKKTKKVRPETELIELKKRERKLFKKQLTDTSIRTALESQLDEEKHKLLKSKSTKSKPAPKLEAQKSKDEVKYDTNNYATFEEFYNREVLYVLPPLFLAVVNGNVSVVKELIKFGANVNSQDANGCTALHLLLCQQRVNQSLLNLLLGNGAKLSITNLAGVAPIDLALEKANQLVGLQRKMIMTSFSGLVNGLETLCRFNELNGKQTMRNQGASGANQPTGANCQTIGNTVATTSTNSTIVTDTVSHSHGNQSSRDNQPQQSRETEVSHTVASSMTGLTSGVFQSSQSSSNAAGDGNQTANQTQMSSSQQASSQAQEHSSSTLISVQQQFNMTEHGEEGVISITQPAFHADHQRQLGVTVDGNSGGSSSGAHSNQTDRSAGQQPAARHAQFSQLNPQLNQSTSNLHHTSEMIKKLSQKSQEDGSGMNLTSVAAQKAANFLRKLKASAKSSKQKKQQQLLLQQQNRLAQQQQETLQQADVYLCLEEISSDGPSHGSNRFAYSSYYDTSSMNNNEVFDEAENQQPKQQTLANVKKEDDLGELHSGSTVGTNSTSVLPNHAGKGRKKSLGKIYGFIEPSAPSGLTTLINSIKGTANSHVQQGQPTAAMPNNMSQHQGKHAFLSSKTSNPLAGLSGAKAGGRLADSNRQSSLVQLDNLFRGAESGLMILIKMATNIECVPFIMQVFNVNLNSIVNVIDRSSNEKLNKMIAVLFNRLLLTIIEQIETSADSIRLANNLTYSKLFKLTKIDLDQQHRRSAALFAKWAAMNENEAFQYVNNLTIGRLSADLSTANRTDAQLNSSNSMLKNLEKLKQFASFQNSIQSTSGINLCKHMRSRISDDLTCLLNMSLGCLRGGQSLQYTALLIVNKIIDTVIVYDLANDRPVRKINSCKCLIHQHNCCKQRAARRGRRLTARLEYSKKGGFKSQQNSLDHKSRLNKLAQRTAAAAVDPEKTKEEEELEQQKKAIALAAAATNESLKALKATSKPATIKRSSIFSAALFGLGKGSGSGSGSDTPGKSDTPGTPKQKQKLTGILTANIRRASIKTGLIKESPNKREKSKSVEKKTLSSLESSEVNQTSLHLNGHHIAMPTRNKNPFISKLSKSLLIARAVGKLSKHSALILHHQQHSSSVESAAEKNLYMAAVAKEDQVNAARRKHRIRRCTCKIQMKSTIELLIQDGVSLLLNVLNNSMTLHKRVAGSKQLCTPSHRWRQCVHHCMTLLSARSLLFLSQNAETRKKLVEPSALKILLSSLDSTNDPQLLTIVLQIVASIALDIRLQKHLLNADFTDALLQIVLPSDEWFYTNHTTKYSRYVKHHAARILVYLGLEKRLRNKVYLFDLLEETLIGNGLVASQNQSAGQPNKQQQANLPAGQQQSAGQANQAHSTSQQQQTGKQQAKAATQTGQQNELNGLSQSNLENAYICQTSLPPLNIYSSIENQQLLIEKERFEQQAKASDKHSDKHLFRHILNELDFEPKLVSSSAESIVLQLLQQIENRLNDGENENEIIELNQNVVLGIDPSQFKTVFDMVERMIQERQAQEQADEALGQAEEGLFKDSDVGRDEAKGKQNGQADQVNQNANIPMDGHEAISASSKQPGVTKFSFTEQQSSVDAANSFGQQPPPSIQVDFISSDRSSPRRSSSQRSSLNAEEANEAAKLAKEKIEEAVNNKLDLRELKLQYQRQIELNNRQQFFLKTLSICLNPVIVLRLLQHRLFGCFNQLWYWQQNNNTSSSHCPSICLSNSNQTALYHLLNTRANNSGRSSFASTIGMDSSFQGGLNSRSRASSATANSIVLPNELIESNLRNRRNVSLTINCPLGLSLSNLNSYTAGGSSSQRTSISVDRSSRQESYRKASVRSGSGDDQSSLFQQGVLISGLNLQPNLSQLASSQDQDEIAEFQKQLQNIPKNESSPICARNFVGLAVSSASNQLLINDSLNQQRRNTATLLPQSMNTSMDSMVVPNRPRSCSMPQQQQQQLANLQAQQQQTVNQIISQITNQIQTLSSQTSSNQQLSSQQHSSQLQAQQQIYQNIQQMHGLTNQQLQTLINQQLQSQNIINQHLQNQFRSAQTYSSNQQLQQQKDKQHIFHQQTDASSSAHNSLEERSHTLYTQGSLDSLSLTPLLVYHHPQQRNFFDRSLSIAVPEPLIFQQTQFKQLMPSQRPQTSSNQSFALDASQQSNLNVNCSHSSVSTNPPAGHFTSAHAGQLSFSLRSTSGGDVYSLLNNLATSSLNNRFMPNPHRAIFLLLTQWLEVCAQDFVEHAHFRKELNEFLNRVKNLGELYLEKVNKIKKSAKLDILELYELYEADDINEDGEVNEEYTMLQQLILSGSLVCSKEDVAKLAGIQLRISEINAYVQQHQEPQQLIINPIQGKQQTPLSKHQSSNIANYSQPNSSKTPPSSSDIFTRTSFEQQVPPTAYNPAAINNLRLSEAANLSSSANNQLASTPTSVVTPLYSSTTGASVKLHPISEYGYNKERNKIRTSGGRGLAFVQAKRFSKPFNVYGNSEEDLDQDPLSSKASSASALESTNLSRKQRSDEYDEEQMDETVFEQEQLEDEDELEELDENERIIENEEEDLDEAFEEDLEFDEEKMLSDDEPSKASRDKSKSSDRDDRPRSRDRLYSDDFEFECDLTDSERYLIKQKQSGQPAQHVPKKTKVPVKGKKRRTSQSSDENLLSPYRRQSVGHSPTNRTGMRPQLINTKRQKKFKSRLHVDAHRRRYSDVFFANTPILQPTSQPSSRLSNISDQAVSGTLSACSSRPSSASKLDSRPQSALDSLLSAVQQQQQQQQQSTGELDQQQKEDFKVAPVHSQLLNNALKEPSSITPTLYVRNRSPSCAVVPSHYLKQQQAQQRAAEAKQAKRRGMSLSFTPSGARHLTNQVTRKLSKQLSKFNQGTKNLLGGKSSKHASPRSKEHSISVESSKDVVREISQLYSSVETPPSSIIIGANVLIYPMVNSPVQATLNQASLAAVASAKLDPQFGFDGAKTKDRDAAISKDGHTFMSQMKKAKNVFRSFIPLQLNADNFTSSLFDLKECLPANYYSAKGIDKSIKEQKRKLFHSQIYDNSLELKKLYIQTCKRLPAYGCELYEVKEIVRTRTTRKRISRILALGQNKVSLLDASSYALTRQQKTKELVEWRSGLGSNCDRVLLEFRTVELRSTCKWNLVAGSSNSLNTITRSLLNIMMNSLQSSSAFLAKLLNVDEKLFILDDPSPFTNNSLTKYADYGKATGGQPPAPPASTQDPATGKPKVLYGAELSTANLSNCEELELLHTMLHFPEEVALRLAEVDYELFYSVSPVDYIQHITLCLNQINLEEQQTAAASSRAGGAGKISQQTALQRSSSGKATVQDLIRRFNFISTWVTHLIIIQPSHDDRKAVLSCLIRTAQAAWNMGAFGTALQIVAGLKCEKIRPFILTIKNNENPKQLNFLIDALLFTDQPSAEYCEGVSRAFSIRQSFLVPFFGNFLKDLHTIFQSMSSLAVRAFNQATINQFNNSPAQPSASLHFGDRRQLDFVFNYNGEDVYMSRIGVGNLVNVEKMNAADRVLQNISAFHIHAGRRLIDLTKCIKAASPEQADADKANGSKTMPANQSSSNIKSSDSREENRQENADQPKTISAQCSPTDRQQTNQPISDLHESTSLVNMTNLTTSASISAGNLNTLASTNAGSVPLSPLATSSTAVTFQQQQISTICNALNQYNLQSNQAASNQATTTPVSATLSTNTTTGLDSNQFLDNNNNRLGEQTEKTGSNQCLHGSVKEPKPKVLASNLVENDALYELDHKYNYKPIQPLAYRHDVSFIPLSGEQFYSNLNALQLMQHGTTCIHYEEETNRISLVYLQLEQSNSILAWSKPPWSALKKNYANNFSFVYSKNQNQTGVNQAGAGEKQVSNQANVQPSGGSAQGAGNLTSASNPTSSTSSAPASDYTLQQDIEDRVMPIILQRFAAPNQIAINGIEEGYIDLFYVKHLSQSSVNQLDFISICKRVGLCYGEFNEASSHVICLQFGANLVDNRRSLFIMTNRVGKMWSDGLKMVCNELKKQRSLIDQRLNWLKFKYLQLFYEGGACQGPTSPQAIHSFGGRKWQLEGQDLGLMHTGSLTSTTGISPLMYLKDDPSSGKGHQQSGSGQSSIDLSGKRASSFAITKLRKKKSTSSLSTMPKEGSPKSRASSGEDLAISNAISGNELEKGKKERFKKTLFHKRSSPNLKCTLNSDSVEKPGLNQQLKGSSKQTSEEKASGLMFSQSSSQDNNSPNSSFCSIDSPPIIFTSQLTFEYQEMLRRNIDQNGLGCCELYSSWSDSSALTKYNQPHRQAIQLSFIEFFELFKFFLIRSRKDVRDLFDSLSSKTITSSQTKLNQASSPHGTLMKQTSVDQASSSISQEHGESNLVRSMSVSDEPTISNALKSKEDSFTKTTPVKPSEIYSPKASTKSIAQKLASEKFKTRKRRLTRQISLNQPLLGLISRNCSSSIVEPNVEKRLQIFDAIATASIMMNCAGLETTGRLTSIPSEGTQQTQTSQLILSYQQFAIFIRNYQKEDLSDEQVISLIQRHEPNHKLREQHCLSFEGFNCYLMDKDNSAFLPQLNQVKSEDMDYPLSHYYIATSHNTYLTDAEKSFAIMNKRSYLTQHQFKGESSADLYGEVLLSGCRCVELDCYDGDDGWPLIYHGRTFTTKIPFRRVVDVINQFAFVTSPYPVILSIENHCSIQQQIRMANTFREVFKEKLVSEFLFDSDYSDTPVLPTPNQLKYRILIKNKKLKSIYNIPMSQTGTMQPQQPQQAQQTAQQPQKQQSLPQQQQTTLSTAASTTPTNQASNLAKMGKSFPSKGFTSDRTNSLISAASTVSLNEDDFDEDEDDDIVISKPLDKLEASASGQQTSPQQQSGNFSPKTPKTTPLKTTRAYSQGSYPITQSAASASSSVVQPTAQQQQQLPQYYFMQPTPKTPYHPKVTRKSSSQVAKELSDLVIYCQAIKFRSLFADDRLPMINSPTNMSSDHLSNLNSQSRIPNVYAGVFQVASLSENYAKKIYRKSPTQLVNYNHHNLLRIYPAPTRLQSSNFNPILFFAFGVQLVALNYQTEDQFLAINQTMFEQTNSCGYVLKPEVMRPMKPANHIMYGKFNPLDSKFDGLYAVDLTIKIISGQYVCEEHNGSPLVEVEIIGLEADCNKQRTKVVPKNCINPIWNDTFTFRINFIDLALVRFSIYEYGTSHLTSQRIVPVKSLRPGYRHLALRNSQNRPLQLSSLFIYSNIQEEVCLIDDPSSLGSNLAQPQLSAGSIESLYRRLVIIQLHNVRPDETSTIMKLPQEATTTEIILQAINKQKQYQAGLQAGNLAQQVQAIQDQLQRSTTFRQQIKILMDAYSSLINDFVLIEEIQRQPSQSLGASAALQAGAGQSQRSSPATQIYSQEIKSERCQRILEAEEKPLEGYPPSACANRKFILKKISDDPSCRAWFNTLMKNQNKYSNAMSKKYLEDGGQMKADQQQLVAISQQQGAQQQISNLSPSGKRSSSSLSGSMKKELYAKEDGSDESSDSELSENGILAAGGQMDQNNELLNVQLTGKLGSGNELVKAEARLISKSSNFNQWIEEPIESFLVCVCNVSIDQPYTILKCNVKCTSLDVINQCLIKARRQNENCENFVLVEELINESSSSTTTFNASLLDPLMSLGTGPTNALANQPSAANANVLNCAGLSSSTYTVNTQANALNNLPTGAQLNVGQTSAGQSGLFSFNSNCSLNRKDAANAITASNNTLSNTAYVRRILPPDENVYEVQRYWFGRGRLRLMLKIEAIRIPNILIPDNFDLRIPNEPMTSHLIDSEEMRDASREAEAGRDLRKDASKEEKSLAQNKTMKTFRSIKKSMSIKKKEYESAPSTPSKYSAQKVQTPVKAVHADDMMPSTSKQMMQNRSQSVYHTPTPAAQQPAHSSPTQSFFRSNMNAASQITGQINRFTKHARNSLKRGLNRFGTKKGDKERDETTDSTRSSTYD